jgi:hypothetical protein
MGGINQKCSYVRNSCMILISLVLLMSVSSCQKEVPPTVITHYAGLVTSGSALVSADVVSGNGATVTARGLVWSTSQYPDISDNSVIEGLGEGFYKVTITGLEPGTTYYVRAFAENSEGKSYGNQISFTTLGSEPDALDVISLGPNSRVILGAPVISEVELHSEGFNEGPGTLNYLRFHTLYPVNRINQEVLEIRFFPPGGQLLTDDRRQPLIFHEFLNLPQGASTSIYWRARIKTRSLTYEIDPDDVGTLADVPADIADEYLADEDQWKINDPIVVNARDNALQGETHPLGMAKKIYHWVQNHMDYVSGLGWADAPTNITRASGTCSDYAFVFISMCRSAGLPARWTGALVRRGAQNVPGPFFDEPHHRWAQVYLPGIGWVEANVQGGTWGYLRDGYVVISESSGPSNYMGIRYDSYRRWSFNGTGTLELRRYALWWPVFNAPASIPAVPVPEAPANEAINVPTSQALSWSEVPMATSYRMEISRDMDFSTIHYYNGQITGTSHVPEWTGQKGVRWYWRVSASNIAGTSQWSTVWSFTR